jgi:hypothetical protein
LEPKEGKVVERGHIEVQEDKADEEWVLDNTGEMMERAPFSKMRVYLITMRSSHDYYE